MVANLPTPKFNACSFQRFISVRIPNTTPEQVSKLLTIRKVYMKEKWNSYWYVCTNCDASIEVVSKGLHYKDPTCNCNNSSVVWCQTKTLLNSK